jgi:hypothetical protein
MSPPANEKSGEPVEPEMAAADIRGNARAFSDFLR